MTGYLSRLAARGAGTDPGPQVRAVSRLYAPSDRGDDFVVEDAETPAPRRAAPTGAALPSGDLVAKRTPRASVEPGDDVPRPITAGSTPDVSGARRQADGVDAERAIRPERRRDGPLESDAPKRHRSVRETAPKAQEQPAAARKVFDPDAAAASPGSTVLEALFDAIEPPPMQEPAPWHEVPGVPASAAATAAVGSSATPGVTIGRIDISVVPPASPPADPRTRGFGGYAGLRRGLVR